MKKIIFASILLGTTTLASYIAKAADLPPQAPAPYRAPVAVAPAFDWSGFYIGAMGGWGWSNSVTIAGLGITNPDFTGGFAGGTVGYNAQIGQLVVGIEADGAWSNINHTETDIIFGNTLTLKDKILAFGSVTGRIGGAVQNVLIYGKGGYAWADNQISAAALGQFASESHFHNGWTVGGGVEWAFAGPWSAKAEYMFARYLNESYLAALGAGGVPISADVHTVKVGINYRFNTPITARY